MVQLLIQKYPDAMKEKDGSEVLPLHRIIEAKMNAPMLLQFIINAHPQAAKAKERISDSRLPVPIPIEVYLKHKDAEDSVLARCSRLICLLQSRMALQLNTVTVGPLVLVFFWH